MKKSRFNILGFLFIIVFLITIKADVISVNSGGNNQMCITSGGNIEECFSGEEGICTPMTCASLGYNCGSWGDGCGGTLDCGTCASGYTCSSGVCTLVEAPSGGGPGGPSVSVLTDLEAIPDNFNLAMTANMKSSVKLDLSNIGKSNLNIVMSFTNSLKDIILFDEETAFTLNSGESKTLNFQIISPSEAGIYTGKIIFTSGRKVLEVPFVLNVREGINLFDISLDIAEDSRVIDVGEKLTGQINLIQAGVQEPMDVSLHYIVKDFEDNIYLEETETIMVNIQKNYEHEFNTQNLSPGNYIIGAEVIYEGGVATASYPFEVVEKGITTISLIYIIIIIVLIIAILSILLIIKYYKQQKRKYRRR